VDQPAQAVARTHLRTDYSAKRTTSCLMGNAIRLVRRRRIRTVRFATTVICSERVVRREGNVCRVRLGCCVWARLASPPVRIIWSKSGRNVRSRFHAFRHVRRVLSIRQIAVQPVWTHPRCYREHRVRIAERPTMSTCRKSAIAAVLTARAALTQAQMNVQHATVDSGYTREIVAFQSAMRIKRLTKRR
jgi:hypothetical protein